jgi:hypothetical protein
MVGPAETQAREAVDPEPSANSEPARRLTGVLVREINKDGPAYPIRLRSPEGRLIAYVDLSALFISDLSPFIGQPVNLVGELRPLRPNTRELVILAREIRAAE